jgi:hypothetical protein
MTTLTRRDIWIAVGVVAFIIIGAVVSHLIPGYYSDAEPGSGRYDRCEYGPAGCR